MATDDHMAVTVGLSSATSMSFGRFELENGQYIDDVVLGYTTYGDSRTRCVPLLPPRWRELTVLDAFFCLSRRDPRVAHSPILAPDHPLASQAGDNAVIVGHSLTSNGNVLAEWWGAILGEGPEYSLDHSNDFVVCAPITPASAYGSSSPVTPDPKKANGECYAADFPHPGHHP